MTSRIALLKIIIQMRTVRLFLDILCLLGWGELALVYAGRISVASLREWSRNTEGLTTNRRGRNQ